MKFFITGGAGFIGSVLVDKLLQSGNYVTVYDDFSLGKKRFLKKGSKKLKVIYGKVQNRIHLQKTMKGHNFVFHFAANSDIPAGIKNSRLDFEINTIGTLNVLDSMVKNKINNLVFASSSAIFGYPTKFPTPEEYGPCMPESFYGASKLAAEGFVFAFANLYGIKSWVFRFANITGSPATHGIIYDFNQKLRNSSKKFKVLGDGNQEKSYITNEMLIDGMLKIIRKTKNRKQKIFLYNIGNKDNIKVKDIAKIFLKENDSHKKIYFTGGKGGWKGDIHKMQLDIRKILKGGWTPEINSEQSILKSIRNYWD